MKFGARSDKGKVRETNEDSYNILAGYPGVPASFIIADGMGGHNSGEIASRAAVDYVSNHLLQLSDTISGNTDIPSIIYDIVEKTNAEVYQLANEQESTRGMGTTFIIAVVWNQTLYIGHIGDSRVYLVRNGTIQRITTDHSYIEELLKNGSITRQEAESHPKKNIITRALGCSERVDVDLYTCDISDNDVFLMCTDGLTNMIEENEIMQIILKAESPQMACDLLVNKANENGGEDNITVVVFKDDK